MSKNMEQNNNKTTAIENKTKHFFNPYHNINHKKKLTDFLIGFFIPLFIAVIIFFLSAPPLISLGLFINIIILIYAIIKRRWFIILGYISNSILFDIIENIFLS